MSTDRDSKEGTEEIREKIRELIIQHLPCPLGMGDDWSVCPVHTYAYGCNCAEKAQIAIQLQNALHSKGVVIKVERELPEYENLYDTPMEIDKHEIQLDMLEAGYSAWEPLIGDKDG